MDHTGEKEEKIRKKAKMKETKRCLLRGVGELQKFRARRNFKDHFVEPSIFPINGLG